MRARHFEAGADDYAEYVFQYDTLTVTRPPAHTYTPRDLSVKVLKRITPPEGNPWVIRDDDHDGGWSAKAG